MINYIAYLKSKPKLHDVVEYTKIYSKLGMLDKVLENFEDILNLCYYDIKDVIYTFETNRDNYITRYTRSSFKSLNINIKDLGEFERYHLATVALFKLIVRFVKKQKTTNIIKFIKLNLPLYYAIEVKYENKELRLGLIINKKFDGNITQLPSSSNEYVHNYLKTNLTKYSKELAFIKRSNVYKMFKF